MPRPLPALTPDTEFFWKAGAEGVLRFQKCVACGALLHPPGPNCPYCQGTELTTAAVSGRGVVVGFTVNYHTWLPSFPPPYVIAIVAIEEDDRVRLTTNIVGCPAEDVHVGMRVQVQFEQQEDVWIPLFTPASDTTPGPIPEPEVVAPYIRPMASPNKFEDKVAITGIGMSRLGRRLMVNPLSLTLEACRNAVADAGLRMEDIDGLCSYPGGPGLSSHNEGGITAVEEALRIRPTWFNGAQETPGQSGSLVAAMLAVAAGLCRHVLCFRTLWEATHAAQQRAAPPGGGGSGRVSGDMQWRFPYGAASAANWIAMNAQNHFHRYGTTREALATVALTARKHAALTPYAIYKEPLTREDYFAARMITTPFGLYDCDVPCDGSVAIIVSAVETARDLRQPVVRVEAAGTQIVDRISWDQSSLAHEPQTVGPGAHLWTRTNLRPSDVDVAEIYDGFSFNCLSWLEAMNFCAMGEGGDFLSDPSRFTHGGALPLNTHGGQLSAGRTHGYGFLHEAVVQLRGQGGDRQVAGAEVAAISTGGGTPGGCFLFTKGR